MNQPEFKSLQSSRIIALNSREEFQYPEFNRPSGEARLHYLGPHPHWGEYPNRQMEHPFVTRLTALIEANLDDETYDIARICRDIGASRTQLHKKLKKFTGLSTSIFVRNIRLKAAKELLVSSYLRISEIAYEVGFNDPRYFSRLFTDYAGVNPRDFRKCGGERPHQR